MVNRKTKGSGLNGIGHSLNLICSWFLHAREFDLLLSQWNITKLAIF